MDDLAEGEIIVSCIRVFLFLSRLPTDLVMIRETKGCDSTEALDEVEGYLTTISIVGGGFGGRVVDG